MCAPVCLLDTSAACAPLSRTKGPNLSSASFFLNSYPLLHSISEECHLPLDGPRLNRGLHLEPLPSL